MTVALTRNELDAIVRPTLTAHGLPNRFYTSAPATELERDSVLSSTWTCLGFAGDVPSSHAQPVSLMGMPLVMVKTSKGAIYVFHNVCRHRGHRLVSDTCRLKGAIRCPYHSWTYDFDGTLRGTPHIGGHGIHKVVGFDKSERGLFRVRSAVWLDMVFVNLSGDAPAFEEYLQPLLERWRQFVGADGLHELRPANGDGRMELELQCNWKLAVENYCESYHLPWIHPGLNSYSKIEDHYNIVAKDWGAGQGSRVFEFTERAGISLPRFENWPADKLKIAEYIALFPNVLVGLQNDHFFAFVLRPDAPDRTTELIQLYYLGDTATRDDYAHQRKVMLEGWREVFLEDVGVCEAMQQGRMSPAFDGGAFSPALDVPTHYFHQWVAHRLPVSDNT
ncbi:aromatic ring-hydroxylating dioxygenase subunit alpha [Gammaproteobacteria bacterium]|nr:aromatic ring-hydroxylating dioxygenase subunit alpha [Gammaproteobacteria bacterium]